MADYRVNFDTFAEYLLNQNDSKTENSNMLVGYNIHEIEEILNKRAFVCGGRIITTFDGLRDYLDRFIYRLLPAYHPTLPEPDSLNMELHFHLLTLDDSKNGFKLKTKFLITASWTAGLAERRFPGQQPDCIPIYEDLPRLGLLKQIVYEGRRCFSGPRLFLRTRTGLAEDPLPVNDLEFFLTNAKWVDDQVHFTSKAVFSVDLPFEGDSHRFPFDTVAFNLTVIFKYTEQLQFSVPDEIFKYFRPGKWIINLKETALANALYNLRHEVTSGNEKEMRARISVEITCNWNKRYWLWKVLFPMDVITVVGITAFLLVRELSTSSKGPTPDQRLSVVTFLVTVLVAQAAFSIQAQGLLPDVSRVTIMDVHNNFCFTITVVLVIAFASIPSYDLAVLSEKVYLVLAAACLLLILEHIFLFFLFPRWFSDKSSDGVVAMHPRGMKVV